MCQCEGPKSSSAVDYMAPHAGTARLKVLLAGTSQLDLGEAQTFLSGEGAVGMFCGAFNLAILRFSTAS